MFRGLPGWARWIIYVFGGGGMGLIQLGSSWSLGSLAYQAGLGWPRLILLPIALDLGATVTATLWVAGKGEHRTTGRRATLSLVCASVGFNVADSVAQHGDLSPKAMLYVSISIAAIFPLAAALLGHIVLMVRESDSAVAAMRAQERELQEQRDREHREELQRIEAKALAKRLEKAEGVPEGASPLVAALPGNTKEAKLKAHIEDQWAKGVDKSAAQFERELYGKETGYARKVVRTLKEEGVLPPSKWPSGDRPRLQIASSG